MFLRKLNNQALAESLLRQITNKLKRQQKLLEQKFVWTSEAHNSGTERLAEAVSKLGIADDEIIVNIQGDEPLIPPVIVESSGREFSKI